MNPIGIIDIGSNSIKSLVVHSDAQGRICMAGEGRSPTRIGTGLSDNPPRIREADIDAAADAIRRLIAEADTTDAAEGAANTGTATEARDVTATPTAAGAVAFELYATSAIREASNRDTVVSELAQRCAAPLTVLSGEEEATLIGWAARSMPELAAVDDLLIADLGGGSLELLHMVGGRVRQKCSLHLGAVRLTTEFFHGGQESVSAVQQAELGRHIDTMLAGSGFDFNAAASSILVGSGGALSALHHMDCFVHKEEHSAALGSIPLMPLTEMQALYESACEQTSEARARVSGFPKNRADIMPAALLVLLRLANLSRANAYAYCAHNLRFGLAAWKVYQSRSDTPWTPADPIPAITIHS